MLLRLADLKGWTAAVAALALIAPAAGASGFPVPKPPTKAATTKTTAQPSISAQSSATADIESKVTDAINTIRKQHKLSPLRVNVRLMDVSRDYSRQMATQDFFSHSDKQGKTVVQRVGARKIAWSQLGENLAWTLNSPDPVKQAVDGWMNSPPHRANILKSSYTDTGVGVWYNGNKALFTQVFLRGR
jgi:uncharacterized protein YkwD